MAISTWVGSVWSLKGQRGPVVGRVSEVDGPFVTLSVVGMEGQSPEGVELFPAEDGVQLARVPTASLLTRWKRLGGEAT